MGRFGEGAQAIDNNGFKRMNDFFLFYFYLVANFVTSFAMIVLTAFILFRIKRFELRQNTDDFQVGRPTATVGWRQNKAGYTATLVACGWAGAVLEKVTRASGQEPYAQKAQKRRKSKKGTNRPTDRPIT